MKYLKFIKLKRDYYFNLYLIEIETKQKNKYMHLYEAYYMLYQELINKQINNKSKKNENEQI